MNHHVSQTPSRKGPASHLSGQFPSWVVLPCPPPSFKATASVAEMQTATKVSGSLGGGGAQAHTGPRRLGQCTPETSSHHPFLMAALPGLGEEQGTWGHPLGPLTTVWVSPHLSQP